MEGLSRRELLRRGAVAGAGALAAPALGGWGGIAPSTSSRRMREAPRVAIVGAGLAGLACADRLHALGVTPVVFEANPERIGGRCWSSRGWADGLVAEHGGEFIDTRHARIRALAKRLGLTLTDLAQAPLHGSSRLWLKGRRRRFEPLAPGRERFVEELARQARRIGDYGYRDPSPAARRMDEMSVTDWLDEHVDGGSGSLLGRMIGVEMTGEFGLDARDLSALNLLYEYVEAPAGADERFHVAGGNDQLVSGLAEGLPEGTIRMDAPLSAIVARRDRNSYALRIGDDLADRTFDRVVLCLPFTRLREVELDRSGLSRKKRRCIDRLGMGTNAKVILQTSGRPQAYGGWNGFMLSDRPNFISWESSLGQPGAAGLITTYRGGRSGARGLRGEGPHGPASAELTASTLADYQRAGISGIAGGRIGEAWVDHWRADPYVRGAYAAFLPGQYTRFYGFAGRREGGIHFAGEHTATDYQGFLEGAVESGQRAAREVHAGLTRRRA